MENGKIRNFKSKESGKIYIWRQGDTGGLFNIELKVIYEQLEIGYVE